MLTPPESHKGPFTIWLTSLRTQTWLTRLLLHLVAYKNFFTNSTYVHIRWTSTGGRCYMSHYPSQVPLQSSYTCTTCPRKISEPSTGSWSHQLNATTVQSLHEQQRLRGLHATAPSNGLPVSHVRELILYGSRRSTNLCINTATRISTLCYRVNTVIRTR